MAKKMSAFIALSIFLTIALPSLSLAIGNTLCSGFYNVFTLTKFDFNGYGISKAGKIDIEAGYYSPSRRSVVVISSDRKEIELLSLTSENAQYRELHSTYRIQRHSEKTSFESYGPHRSMETIKKYYIFQRPIAGELRDFVGIEWSDRQVQFFELKTFENYYGALLESATPIYSELIPNLIEFQKSGDLAKYFKDVVELGLKLKLKSTIADASSQRFQIQAPSNVVFDKKSDIDVKLDETGNLTFFHAKENFRNYRRIVRSERIPPIDSSKIKINRPENGSYMAIHWGSSELYIVDAKYSKVTDKIHTEVSMFHKENAIDIEGRFNNAANIIDTNMQMVKNVFGREIHYIASIWTDGSFIVYSFNKTPGFSPTIKPVHNEKLTPEWIAELVKSKGTSGAVKDLFDTYFRETALIVDPNSSNEGN